MSIDYYFSQSLNMPVSIAQYKNAVMSWLIRSKGRYIKKNLNKIGTSKAQLFVVLSTSPALLVTDVYPLCNTQPCDSLSDS